MKMDGKLELAAKLLAAALLLPCSALAAEQLPVDAGSDEGERQLRHVRDALVSQALAEGTRISSAAWIDHHGVLHENTRFRSDLRLRGIRIPSYLPAPAYAESDLAVQGEVADVAVAEANDNIETVGASGEPVCGPSIDLRSVAAFDTRVAVAANLPQHSALKALNEFVTAELRQQFAVQPRWHLIEGRRGRAIPPYWARVEGQVRDTLPLRLTLLIDLPRGETAAVSDWGQQISQHAGQLHAGWMILRDQWPLARQRRYRAALRIMLHEGDDVAPIWTEEMQFEWRDASNGMGSPPFPPLEQQRLRELVSAWVLEIDRAMECRIPRFPILEASGQDTSREFVIAAGAQAGVRVGDRFIIADGRRVPAAILEEGVVEQMQLGEVVDVQAHRARLRAVAGGSANVPVNTSEWVLLVALPL